MPRVNKGRKFPYETQLARRVQYEREARDLTYERLAEKLTEVGCPIQGSAIFKIEKGEPPRRITVNELVAFAQVFEKRVNELLVPVELAAEEEALAAFEDWTELIQRRSTVIREIDERIGEASGRLRMAIGQSEVALEAVRAELVARFGEDSHWVDDLMEQIRG